MYLDLFGCNSTWFQDHHPKMTKLVANVTSCLWTDELKNKNKKMSHQGTYRLKLLFWRPLCKDIYWQNRSWICLLQQACYSQGLPTKILSQKNKEKKKMLSNETVYWKEDSGNCNEQPHHNSWTVSLRDNKLLQPEELPPICWNYLLGITITKLQPQ